MRDIHTLTYKLVKKYYSKKSETVVSVYEYPNY